MVQWENIKRFNTEIDKFISNVRKDNQNRRKNCEQTIRRLGELEKFKIEFESIKLGIREEINKSREVELIRQVREASERIDNKILEVSNLLRDRLTQIGVTEKMGESFDLKTACSLLPRMDGTEDGTKQLIDSIRLYADLLKDEDHKVLINYVLKTRITENAKIRLNKVYETVERLTNDIRENFISKQSAIVLAGQLHNMTQQNQSIEKFGEKLEQLLSNLSIAQAGQDDAALRILYNVNEKNAINVFCNGLRNPELRTIVKSRNCEKLRDAITIAKNEEVNEPSANLFHFNRRVTQQPFQKFRYPTNRARYSGYSYRGNGNFKNRQAMGNRKQVQQTSTTQQSNYRNRGGRFSFNRGTNGVRDTIGNRFFRA
ncbi:hypothetical protein RI129_011509 [Pyrocoelia pectoralis]|uniref:Uncharacterized protein n=1 Tax=Pyrocoelia pectoralis TaxID=417401 RepID=A0AAN7ZD05_9COLE